MNTAKNINDDSKTLKLSEYEVEVLTCAIYTQRGLLNETSKSTMGPEKESITGEYMALGRILRKLGYKDKNRAPI